MILLYKKKLDFFAKRRVGLASEIPPLKGDGFQRSGKPGGCSGDHNWQQAHLLIPRRTSPDFLAERVENLPPSKGKLCCPEARS